MKFNQFNYSQLMFLKSIKKYLRKSIFVEQEKNLKNLTFRNKGNISLEPEIQFLLQLILIRFGSTSAKSSDGQLDQLVQLA